MISMDIIDKALNFYNIDLQYRDKCYNCVEEINKKDKLSLEFSKLYKKLYIEEFTKIKDLWQCKDINELFGDNVNPFITNIMVILGYNYHRKNMQSYNFDATQIDIHKKRVKECFESDLKIRKRNGIRISQMLWAIYFIRIRIIEIGSLQFEYDSDSVVKIHIPKNTDLNVLTVKKSIKKQILKWNKFMQLRILSIYVIHGY